MRSGFLVINKVAGMTSFDVIRQLRRLLGITKLGHSGVLDRPAMGVLVVGAGQATRLFEFFGGFEKQYEADIWLGLRTATDDLTGELLPGGSENPLLLPPSAIAQALQAQLGEIAQQPPAFSLTKVAGRELYRYALAHQPVEVQPKLVDIRQLEVLADRPGAELGEVLPPDSKLDLAAVAGSPLRCVSVRVLCTGGTYIRSIARDLGAALGCGGTLGRLVRLRVGPFTLAEALTLDQVAALAPPEAARLLQPLTRIIPKDALVPLDQAQVALLEAGRPIRRLRQFLPAELPPRSVLFGVYAQPSTVLQLAAVLAAGLPDQDGMVELRPRKVFAQEHSAPGQAGQANAAE